MEHPLLSNGDTVSVGLDIAACFPSTAREKIYSNLMSSSVPRLVKLAVSFYHEYAAVPIFQVRTFDPTEIPMFDGLAQGFASSCLLLALYTRPMLDRVRDKYAMERVNIPVFVR